MCPIVHSPTITIKSTCPNQGRSAPVSLYGVWEARWPHGLRAQLWSKRSGFEPWPGTLCCVLGQDTFITLTVPLSTQVYKWVPANLLPGVTPRWTSIPSRGEDKYSQSLHAIETGISSGLMGHLARMQTYFMIGLNCILQIMSVYYCTITKVNNKEYMPQSREVRSRFLVWSIVTSPLMSLMGS